ncbi:MAG TPA: hypothetical protein VHA52_10970 [Candidatus Babeliaceae bacterium]|nr:hypothetical protein [Candidatus Babeliaceae bacterium]
MKRYLLLITFLSYLLIPAGIISYDLVETKSSITAILNASSQELELLTTLIYWSWARSYSTVKAQESAAEFLNLTLQGIHTITATRFDPTTPATFVTPTQLQESFTNFQRYRILHDLCGKIYSQAVTHIVDGNAISSPELKHFIKDLRLQARKSLLGVLWHIKELPHIAYCYACDQLQKITKNHPKRTLVPLMIETLVNLPQTLQQKIPTSLISALAKGESQLVHQQDRCHQILLAAYQANSMAWNCLEAERCNFYKSYYKAVYNLLKANFPTRAFYITNFENSNHDLFNPNKLDQSLLTFIAS